KRSVHAVHGNESLLSCSRSRRHTSWPRDWSSGVCSSDLAIADRVDRGRLILATELGLGITSGLFVVGALAHHPSLWYLDVVAGLDRKSACRERVQLSVLAVAFKKQYGKALHQAGWQTQID